MKVAKPLVQRRSGGSRYEIADVVPEWRTKRVEGGNLATCERRNECIAEGGANLQACVVNNGTRAFYTSAHRNDRLTHGRGCGTQVHEAATINLGVGV